MYAGIGILVSVYSPGLKVVVIICFSYNYGHFEEPTYLFLYPIKELHIFSIVLIDPKAENPMLKHSRVSIDPNVSGDETIVFNFKSSTIIKYPTKLLAPKPEGFNVKGINSFNVHFMYTLLFPGYR